VEQKLLNEDQLLKLTSALGVRTDATPDEMLAAVEQLRSASWQTTKWQDELRAAAGVDLTVDVDELVEAVTSLRETRSRFDYEVERVQNQASARESQIREALLLAKTAPHDAVVQLCRRLSARQGESAGLPGSAQPRVAAVRAACALLEPDAGLDDRLILAEYLQTGEVAAAVAAIGQARQPYQVGVDAASWTKGDDDG
jgi:hypothetical protein